MPKKIIEQRVLRVVWLGVLAIGLVGCFQSAGDAVEPTTVDLAALEKLNTPTSFITPLPSEGFIAPTDTPFVPTAIPVVPPATPTDDPASAANNVIAPTQNLPPTAIEGQPVQPVGEASATLFAPTPIGQDGSGGAPAIAPTFTVLPATPTGLPTDSPCIHTVAPGEWALKIARQYGLDIEALRAANPQIPNIERLNVGDVLNIPSCGATNSGDAANAGPTTAAVVVPPAATPTIDVNNPNLPTPIAVTDRLYTVVSGDTLGGIAAKFNTTVQAIKEVNNLKNDFLSIGQQLKIPEPQ